MVTDAESTSRGARMLYVLRLAKSAWNTDARTDFERPLTRRGERDAPRMGAWLRGRGVKPDYLVSSPAQRAWQTTQRICKELDVDDRGVTRDRRIYEASVRELLEVLSDCPAEATSVLITGHNPGLEDLVIFLCGETELPAREKLMPTAALAGIKVATDWNRLERACGELEFLMHPKMLG